MAEAFAREGATVVICARKQERVDQADAELNALQLSGKVVPRACHVGRLDELEQPG